MQHHYFLVVVDWPEICVPNQERSSRVNANHDPADAIRTAAELIKNAERELAEACAALAAAETHVAEARLTKLEPDAFTMEQVGELLGLSRSTVAVMIRDGSIKSVKLGGARRVFRADLDAYIATARGRAS